MLDAQLGETATRTAHDGRRIASGQRPKYVLSGAIHRGERGYMYTIVSATDYGCGASDWLISLMGSLELWKSTPLCICANRRSCADTALA